MKGKKNLEKVIVMGLMLGSIAVPAWAEDINSTTINTAGEGYSIKNTVTGVDNINIDITKGWIDGYYCWSCGLGWNHRNYGKR